jgi:hypothetical protein
MIKRRALLTGLAAAGVVAPAIVRAGSLMPVKVVLLTAQPQPWLRCNGQWVEKALYPQLSRLCENATRTYFQVPDVMHLGPPGTCYHIAAGGNDYMPVGTMVLLKIGDEP